MAQGYSGDDMQVLEGLDAVRKRPGMYIGSTDTKGMTHLFFEVFDNAVDEAIAGHCSRIEVQIHTDGSVEVSDNGRGIPVDKNKATGLTGVEIAFGKLHGGGKFGGSGYKSAGGLHGVGAAVVNALSTRTDVVVRRDGGEYEMSFQRGVAGTFAKKDSPDSKFTKKPGIRKIGKSTAAQRGTTVRFWPDKTVFLADAVIDGEAVLARAKQTAFLVPNLAINVRDHTKDGVYEETFQFAGGIADMVDVMSSGKPLCDIVQFTGTGTFLENVPMADKNGHMVMTEVERTVEIDVALRWTEGFDTKVSSFVNVVSTPKGGTHIKGFQRALLAGIRKGFDGTRLQKQGDEPVIWDDVEEGLVAVVSVSVPEPQFVGQTKEELGTAGVNKAVADAVAEGVRGWLVGKKKAQARRVLEKVANAAKIRVTQKTQKDAARRKSALEGGNSMPAKLVDCRANGIAGSELLIVEGDSALGSARSARNSEFQALLPIRGKILNVQKASLKAVLDNAECASIIQVLGAGSGKTFDLDQARYERVVLLADADVDGSHIRVLLITLFFKYMRPFVEAGRLYTAVPPLHRVETLGKGGETIFTYTEAEMQATVNRLEKAGKKVKMPVPRFKGLGEMDADELWETTMNPEVRMLRQITMEDAEAAEEMLELLMGPATEPRREYIVANPFKGDLDV
jgi:DNA gyrase subunit B